MFSFKAKAGAVGKRSAGARERLAPGPRGHRLIGSLLDVRRDRIKFITQVSKEYGDLVGFRMGWRRLYLLSHPDHARHIFFDNPTNYRKGIGQIEAKPLLGKGLLTSEGDLWARQRQLLQTAFHSQRLAHFSDTMVSLTQAMLKRWKEYAETGQPLDVAQEMVRLTLNILGSTLFHFNFSSIGETFSSDLNVLTDWVMLRLTSIIRIPLYIPTTRNLHARKALQRLDRIARLIIQGSQQQRTDKHGDLISLLLNKPDADQQGLDEKQIRDEVMTFLLSGHETTAAAISWTLYLLAQHPEAWERLRDEVEKVLAGAAPSQFELQQLSYTRMVIEESLRLYPPVWLIPRQAIADDEISGYKIPANSNILFSVYSLHRHPNFWPNPERFDPERFTTEKASARAYCSYLPFGAGPRSCLGGRFGMMEATIILAMIAQKYHLNLVSDHSVKPEASLTLHPRPGLLMKILKR